MDVRTAQTQLENLLKDTILMALSLWVPQQPTIAALRAFPSRGASELTTFNDDTFISVATAPTQTAFRWSQLSTATDDGATVIQPSDVPAGANGRWLAWSSPLRFSPVVGGNAYTLDQLAGGPLKKVIVLDQEMSDEEVTALLTGVQPAVFIEAHGDRPLDATENAGHRWLTEFEFTISILAQNLRPRREAAQGSAVDVTLGANDIDGFLQALLCGTQLSAVEISIRNAKVGRGKNWKSKLAERRVVRSRDYLIQATTEFPNAPNDLGAITDLIVQPQLASLDSNDDSFDSSNYLTAGMGCATASGLSQPVAAGTAIIAGNSVTYAGQTETFGAYMDTYRDLLPSGSMVFVAVSNSAPAPAVTATALRIGFCRTNGVGVTDDVILAATLSNYGSPVDIQL
jgi:hypothetical protein